MNIYLKKAILFLVAGALGRVLYLQGVPIPYMLGGIIAATLTRIFIDKSIVYEKKWREYALLAAGYGIGRNFTDETAAAVMAQGLGVFEACASCLSISLIIAVFIARHSFANLISSVMGMMPGGLTIMMILSEEDKRCDANVVMVMQTLRMFSVVISVPFLAVYGLGANVMPDEQLGKIMANGDGYHWAIFLPLGMIGWYIAKSIHFPAPRLIGPVFAAAIFSVAVHPVLPIPGPVMGFAQLLIGLVMGSQLDKDRLLNTYKLLPHIFIGSGIMIAVSVAVAFHLSSMYGFSLITAFLAMAPGGITEMCLAGLSMGEDVSIILTYQFARMIMICFLVPVGIKWWFKKHDVE
ncbi:MAG: AbrB family transcriptional regulator [Phascolarctobacterium sp.]|nr:AbrB family transcriptional regulator [Phascolarctobacterium sp.]